MSEVSGGEAGIPTAVGVARRAADAAATARANRRWWDATPTTTTHEHGEFLGAADFVWCPERLREDDAHLLGDVRGQRVLEVGCGAAMCSRWLAGQGAGRSPSTCRPGCSATPAPARPRPGSTCRWCRPTRSTCRSATRASTSPSPRSARSRSSPTRRAVMREVARVLRAGGRWVFATTHPIRWAFPDDPGPDGLRATMPYFDRTPYVEFAADGTPTYVEHHRTLGDRVREIAAAGFAWSTSSSPSGRPGTPRSGVSGRRCAARSCPEPRSTSASCSGQ